MNKLLLALCFILVTQPALAQKNYGVDAQERVVRLPEDGSKWHISVVGNGQRYEEILGWFENVPRLKSLKDQVQFHPVTPTDPIYAERYAPNVKALPLVRVQDAKGGVIFEAAGKKLPMSGEALYSAIAGAVNGAEELLPWRRHNKKAEPKPEPAPDVTPVPDGDPEPQPLDNGDEPVLEDPEPDLTPILIVIACIALLVGCAVGQAQASKKYHSGTK